MALKNVILKPDFVVYANAMPDEERYPGEGKRIMGFGVFVDEEGDIEPRPINEFKLLVEGRTENDAKRFKIEIDSEDIPAVFGEENLPDEAEGFLTLKFQASEIGQDGKRVLYIASDEIVGGEVTNIYPWKPRLYTVEEDEVETTYLELHPGSINGTIPTNMFSTFEITDPEATNYVILSVSTNSSGISSMNLSTTGSMPDPIPIAENAPPSNFVILICVVRGGEALPVRNTNLTAAPAVAFTTDKESFELGENPNVYYYTWTLLAS